MTIKISFFLPHQLCLQCISLCYSSSLIALKIEWVVTIEEFLKSYTPRAFQRHIPIKFVKPGRKLKKTTSNQQTVGSLLFAEDWKVLCDKMSSLVVPVFLAVTTLRPDIIIYSSQKRVVIIIELLSKLQLKYFTEMYTMTIVIK